MTTPKAAEAPEPHVHLGEWCAPCVTQGREYERRLNATDGNEVAQPVAAEAAGPGLREAVEQIADDMAAARADAGWGSDSWERRLRAALDAVPSEAGIDVERLARAMDVVDRRHHDPERGAYRGLDDSMIGPMMVAEADEIAAEYQRLGP